MTTGTKSILVGVHQFLWHPWTVGRAWRDFYKKWPTFAEWVAIFLHDAGYWGSPNLNDVRGQDHPRRSDEFLCRWTFITEDFREEVSQLILGHSKYFHLRYGIPLSKLYAADKVSVLFDPVWFYLLRARLSGEIYDMESAGIDSPEEWLFWYRAKVRKEFNLE